MAIKAGLAFGLQKSIGSLWKGDDFSDFTVVVEDTSFQCHRFILSACSGFFQGLFRSQMKECQENCANIVGMTASTFEVIINSLYTGVNGLTKDNVLDVWSGAVQLQIGHLIVQCEKFVKKKISVNNCFKILRSADMFSAQKMVDHSIEFMCKHFDKIGNTESLLQIPYDYFCRIIESDYLGASYENVVVETVIKWVEYTPNILRQDSKVSDKSVANDFSEDNVETADTRTNNLETADASRNSVETAEISRNNVDNDDTCTNDVKTADTNTNNMQIDDSSKNNVETADISRNNVETDDTCTNNVETAGTSTNNAQTDAISRNNLETVDTSRKNVINFSNNCDEVKTEREERKKHLFTLISACRLFLISPEYLETLLRNCKLLQSCRETYSLVVDAVMYQWQVAHRHDTWPEAAVHRWASFMKHVMVFLSNGTFVAYDLNSGSIHELTKTPETYYQSITINVFDNILYLEFIDRSKKVILSIYQQEESWHNLMYTERHTAMLAHGCHIYGLNNSGLEHMYCKYGHKTNWSLCCELDGGGDFLVRYQKYLLILSAIDDKDALCYNTETYTIHELKSMDGTFKDMTSFSHQGDVYILQRNGSLWKIVSSDTEPVGFELISKLWDQDYTLRGCVVYRKQLFVFCLAEQQLSANQCLTSLPGIYNSIKIVKVKSESPCLPMVLPEF